MKSCPTCNRTYPDDTLAFCLMDGSVLSAPYDPATTNSTKPARNTNPPVTEVFSPGSLDSMPPKQAASKDVQSTIHAPYQPPAAHQQSVVLDSSRLGIRNAPRNSSIVKKLVIGLVVVVIMFIGVFVFLEIMFATHRSTAQNTMPPAANINRLANRKSDSDSAIKTACTHTLSTNVYDKWIELGGETGKLGCPVNDETDAPESPQGTTGRWIKFAKDDGGYLILHQSGPNSGKVVEVSGCMFKLYSSAGGPKSWLGFPLRDGYETDPGARQEFEGGYIVWDRKTYICDAKKT